MSYPDIKKLRSLIQNIRRIDRKKADSYKEIFDLLRNEIKLIPALTTKLEAKDEILLFRSRVHENDEQEYNTIDDFSYRKNKNLITEYSRCNVPGQQIFYCSEDRPTSYFESLAIKKDRKNQELVSLGVWKLKKDLIVGIIAHPYKEKRYTKFDIEIGNIVDYYINKDFKELETEIREILYFFTIEFRFLIGDHNHYKITAAISNIIFEEVDAIVYPSVPFMGQGNNYAIKKELIDNNSLMLESTLIEKFNRLNDLKIIQDPTFEKKTNKIFYNKNEIKWS